MSDGPSRRVARPAGGTTENLAGKAPTEDLFSDWDMTEREALVAGETAPTTSATARPAETAPTTSASPRPVSRPTAQQPATRPRSVSGTPQHGSTAARQAGPARRREAGARPAAPPPPPEVVVVAGAGFAGRFAAALFGALILPGAVAAMSWPAFLAAWNRTSGVETVHWQLCAIASAIAAVGLLLVALIAAAQGRSRFRSLQTAIAWSVVLMLGLQAWQRYGDTSMLPPPARMAWVILDPITSVAEQGLAAERDRTAQAASASEAAHAAALAAQEAELATAQSAHAAALQAMSDERDAAKAALDAKTAEFLQMQVERDQLTTRAAELEAGVERSRAEAQAAIAAATTELEKVQAELATAREALAVQGEMAERQAAGLQAEIERLKQALIPTPPVAAP